MFGLPQQVVDKEVMLQCVRAQSDIPSEPVSSHHDPFIRSFIQRRRVLI